MRTRRGVSLIELLVVIATSSVMATLGGTTICMLMRAEANGTKSLFASTSLRRMATAFRNDVAAARHVELIRTDANNPAELILDISDEQEVTYRIEPQQVVRVTKFPGEQDVGTNGIERYRLPEGITEFEIPEKHELADQPLLVLVHRLQLGKRTKNILAPNTRDFRIVARMGRDRRFEKSNQRTNPQQQGAAQE